MKSKLNIPAAFLIFFLLYILPLEIRPLFSPDEARYAEIPREMLADHDYVTPRLNGARYFEKPIMGYWLIAGSMKVFHETNFAVRLVPAVSTGLAALIVMLLASKLTGRREEGWFASGAFLLMPLVFIVGTTCTLDAIFSLFVTASVASFYCAVEAEREKSRWRCVLWLALTGAAAGCGFLVKGFLAFALPVAAVLPWLVWEKRWKMIAAMPWLPFVTACAVIAPWAIAVHHAQPDYWRYFVVEEHWNRFFGGEEAQHPESPFFFLLILLWGAAQWFLLSPAIGRGIARIGIRGSWFRFLICWFAGPFLLLSASSGKLPTYILPCFAPLAIMVAAALFRYFEEKPDGKGKLFNVPMMAAGVIMLIGIPIAAVVIYYILPNKFNIHLYGRDESWKLIVAVNALVLTMFGVIASFTDKTPARKLSYFLAACLPVFCASFFIVPESIYDARCPAAFLEECRAEITPDTIIIGHGTNLHAICYAYHRNDLYVIFPGELTYGLTFPEDKARNLAYNRVRQLMDANPGRPVVMFFPTDRYYEHAEDNAFPPAKSVKSSSASDDGQTMVRFR